MATQTLTTANNSLLRNALIADAALCGVSGILCIVDAAPIAGFLGIAQTPVLGLLDSTTFLSLVGVILVATAALIAWILSRPMLDQRLALMVVGANLAWIVLSALILLTGILHLSTEGSWLVLILADVVLVIMLAEIYALRRER